MDFQQNIQRSADLAGRANCHCAVAQSNRDRSHLADIVSSAIDHFITCTAAGPHARSLCSPAAQRAGDCT